MLEGEARKRKIGDGTDSGNFEESAPNPPGGCPLERKVGNPLTLYQPMTHICVMSSHKPIRIYMGGLILDVNTLYGPFCFCKLFPMVGKGLT